ncbi:DUF1835 domain-containing protein [Bacillus rubiinfantis]|uniref:DUF1835 domain-containing protein n=1 Tax=Bacillus rubiinfantis TaxID=1499680 RepID=UPI000694F5AD|nr:DUF1835 domain-containing protein [Bacillus rubiinfantis]
MIKTKTSFPFIYFFIEPNIVFVYKIEALTYLNLKELSQSGEWQTYELSHEAEFEIFNHKEWKPLIGKGYMINQDVHNMMLEKINQEIHKQRMAKPLAKSQTPVHLVCSEATAGALRFGLKQPRMVIGFQTLFSIGPIWQLDQKRGQTQRFQWMNENINLEQDEFQLENDFNRCLLEIAEIPEHAPIYIWTANNGDEQTGLRLLLHLLRGKNNPVFLINVTEVFQRGYFVKQGEERINNHTSGVHPDEFLRIFDEDIEVKLLSAHDRLQYQQEWESLAQTMGLLRIWQDGKLMDVPENYYDSLIISTIEDLHAQQERKDFIRAGYVIAGVLGQVDEPVSDCYLEYRLRHLIYTSVLELKGVPRSMLHYRVKLRSSLNIF